MIDSARRQVEFDSVYISETVSHKSAKFVIVGDDYDTLDFPLDSRL